MKLKVRCPKCKCLFFLNNKENFNLQYFPQEFKLIISFVCTKCKEHFIESVKVDSSIIYTISNDKSIKTNWFDVDTSEDPNPHYNAY